MMRFPVIAILCFAISTISAKHPTHMSVVNIELDSTNLQLNYSIRLFQDDINYLIASLYHEELFHSADTFDLEHNAQKLEDYFIQQLKLYIEGQCLFPTLVKLEFSEYEYWLFFKIKLNSISSKIEIENKILTDIYSDQINLLIFTYNKKEKGLTFDANVTKHAIELDNIR